MSAVDWCMKGISHVGVNKNLTLLTFSITFSQPTRTQSNLDCNKTLQNYSTHFQ